ncbi:MAG TPA: aminotransferase class V-fold PLP-dependent enzyme, partial [Anaerovoracaceae bacterium]|nr:aminotransferase class V-fold PLP-dependent enzyme [Anaerovoracaceae bacterium]
LTLAGAGPIYAYPKIIEKYGISGEISVEEIEKLLEDNPDAAAVILPSPNYYGICSDIDAIAKVVHKYDKVLIVDQAHGAHLKLFNKFGIGNFPKSAEECGADITINSIHKTLASFTQSAVLNLNSTRVSKDDLEDKLQCIESTSPSYILMASLDINARILLDHGYELMNEWNDNLNYFYEKAGEIKGLQLVEKINSMDFSKININFTKLGITGAELEKLLLKHKIYIELYTGDLVMCMTGIGNSRADMKALLKALGEISESSAKNKVDIKTINTAQHSPAFKKSEIHEIPVDKIRVPLLESEGLICASSVIPYPPGIPLVCPGEKFEKDKIEYLKELLDGKHKIIGINEFDEVTAGKK